jgi:hypothetical protein
VRPSRSRIDGVVDRMIAEGIIAELKVGSRTNCKLKR